MDKQFASTRLSEGDMRLIKTTFKDNDDCLKAIRKVFLQMNLSDTDLRLLAPITTSEEMQRILRVFLLPELDGDVGLGLNMDLWMTVAISEKQSPDVFLELSARNKLLDYLEDGFKRLKEPNQQGTTKITAFNPIKVPAGVDDVIARNTLITHIEQKLVMLKMWAAQKEETPEEEKERIAKDSTK